jgi:acetyl-CoA carboxylase carboxyltransferase component
MGASYGAGNYAMNGRAYKPRFLFSWPNSKCSVMGPEQLSGVLDIVARQAMGNRMTKEMVELANQRKEMLTKQIEEESSVYYTSSR